MRAVLITGVRWMLLAVALLWATVTLWPPTLPDAARLWLAERLSAELGQPLTLGAVQLRWGSGRPRVRLEQLVLTPADATAPPLQLAALELELAVWTSLYRRAPRLAALTLTGAELVITRTPDGAWQIAGLEHWHSRDPQALGDFLRYGRGVLRASRLRIRATPNSGEQQLSAVELQFVNHGARHQLDLSATLHQPDTSNPTATPARLQLAAQVTGPAATPTAWSGHAVLRVSGGPLHLPLPARLHPLTRLDLGQSQLESTLTIVQGQLTSASVRADLNAVQFGTTPLTVRQLHAEARLHALAAGGWQVRVRDLALTAADAALADLSLELELTDTGRVRRAAGQVPSVDLTAVRAWLASSAWPVPEAVQQVLALQPRGQVRDLAVHWEQMDSATAPRWDIRARGVNLGWERRAPLPQVAGLDLELTANQTGGWVQLETDALALDWQPLFDRPLRFDQLTGQLSWTPAAAGGWRLAARHLQLKNADLDLTAQAALDWPAPANTAPQLDLDVQLQSGRVAAVRNYLPAGVLSPTLIAWLERALIAGRITRGDLQFHGTPAQFPFRAAPGAFALTLAFDDAHLAYHPDWPPLTAAAGAVQFRDHRLSVQLERGRVFESAVTSGRAELADLHTAERLQIHAETRGPFTDGQRALTDTPLAAQLGAVAERITVGGQAQVSLDIDLPLHGTQAAGVSGVLSWPAPAQLSLRGTALHLTDLGGALRFTAQGLEPSEISARLDAEPITLNAVTAEDGLHLTWRCATLDLNAWRDWSVGLNRDPNPQPVRTIGLAQLELDIERLQLGGRTLHAFNLQGTPTARGWELAIKARELAGRIRSGQRLTLDLERLDLKPLLTATTPDDAPAATTSAAVTDLPSLDLHIERLDWGGQRLGTLDLTLHRDALGMRLPQMRLSAPGLLTASGSGEWQRSRDRHSSRLELALDTAHLARVLTAFGEPAAIEAKTAHARLHLGWPDAPHRFTWARATGQLDLNLTHGRLLDVEPGIGRLLGIVDIGSLGRRLVLDFSDLHQQGFAFEQFSGQIAIQQGQARLDEMRIAGPAATVRITGIADLSRQQLNQRVLIEPRLGSSIAIASAVAGGPVVGAAVYLVDRLTGNTLDRLGRYEYQITGHWNQPTWTRLGWEPLNGLGLAAPAASDAAERSARPPTPFLEDH